MRIIAGTARSRRIVAPEGLDTRPTLDRVRENMFNILQLRVRDARVLDLFAGSGALSLEALSRGAASATLVDHDRAAVAAERTNIASLDFQDAARVLPMDWRQAVRLLTAEEAKFDLAFLDPPYAMRDLTDVFKALRPLLDGDATVVLEHRAGGIPAVADGFFLRDSRRYGYAGVSFLTMNAEGTQA